MKFKFLSHTADIKFQAFGENLEECFKNAALALTNIICKQKIKPIKNKIIKIYGRDLETIKFALPPLPEQKAIAHILSLMDTAINKNNLLIQAIFSVNNH